MINKMKIKEFFFGDGHHYTLIEKYALLIPIIFILFNVPMYFIPKAILTEHTDVSKVISKQFLNEFNEGNVIEITMTNMQNYFNGECYAKQTFTKIDPKSQKPRTYTYWVEYCTGDSTFLYDFRVVNDGGKKLKFYSLYTDSEILDALTDDVWNFGTNITKPLRYFKKY